MKQFICITILILSTLACTVSAVATPVPPTPVFTKQAIPSPVPTVVVVKEVVVFDVSSTPVICTVHSGVGNGYVNIRSCAGVDCSILIVVTDSSVVQILGHADEWTHVKYSVIDGWIKSDLCKGE